jgi:hypothetical protein
MDANVSRAESLKLSVRCRCKPVLLWGLGDMRFACAHAEEHFAVLLGEASRRNRCKQIARANSIQGFMQLG